MIKQIIAVTIILGILSNASPSYSQAKKCLPERKIEAKALKQGYVPILSMRDSWDGNIIRVYRSFINGDGLILHVSRSGCVSMAYEFTHYQTVKIRGL